VKVAHPFRNANVTVRHWPEAQPNASSVAANERLPGAQPDPT
jgi:hypothetical protein